MQERKSTGNVAVAEAATVLKQQRKLQGDCGSRGGSDRVARCLDHKPGTDHLPPLAGSPRLRVSDDLRPKTPYDDPGFISGDVSKPHLLGDSIEEEMSLGHQNLGFNTF